MLRAKSEVAPNKGEQKHKWRPHPCLLGGPNEGGNATSPLHSRGSPTKEDTIRSGCLTLTVSGAQKRAEMLRQPCILRDAQRWAQGAKSEPAPNKGKQNQKWSPTERNEIRSGYLPLAFSRAQKRVKMLRQPCILGGPQR